MTVNLNIQKYFSFNYLRKIKHLSERELANFAKISRGSLRKIENIENNDSNLELLSLVKLANYFKQEIVLLSTSENIFSEYSTIATAFLTERDGFDSWKIHYFNFIDEFRRTHDPRLILLPPHKSFDKKLFSLLASIVKELCNEIKMSVPKWAKSRYFLKQPWFIAEIESLKASVILESPLAFRNNNIYVHNNFLQRL